MWRFSWIIFFLLCYNLPEKNFAVAKHRKCKILTPNFSVCNFFFCIFLLFLTLYSSIFHFFLNFLFFFFWLFLFFFFGCLLFFFFCHFFFLGKLKTALFFWAGWKRLYFSGRVENGLTFSYFFRFLNFLGWWFFLVVFFFSYFVTFFFGWEKTSLFFWVSWKRLYFFGQVENVFIFLGELKTA